MYNNKLKKSKKHLKMKFNKTHKIIRNKQIKKKKWKLFKKLKFKDKKIMIWKINNKKNHYLLTAINNKDKKF